MLWNVVIKLLYYRVQSLCTLVFRFTAFSSSVTLFHFLSHFGADVQEQLCVNNAIFLNLFISSQEEN